MSGLLTLPSFEAQFPNTAGGFQGSRTATLQSFMVAICKFWIAPQYTWLFSNYSPRRDWLYDGCHFKYLDWWPTWSSTYHLSVSQSWNIVTWLLMLTMRSGGFIMLVGSILQTALLITPWCLSLVLLQVSETVSWLLLSRHIRVNVPNPIDEAS